MVLQALNSVACFFRFWVSVSKLLCPVLTASKKPEYALIKVRNKKLQYKSRFPECWTASESVAEASVHFHSLAPEMGIARTAFVRNY